MRSTKEQREEARLRARLDSLNADYEKTNNAITEIAKKYNEEILPLRRTLLAILEEKREVIEKLRRFISV